MLTKIPERYRGWFYLALALTFLAMLVVMFVVAVLRGEDLADWLLFVLGGLGLSGFSLASANTSRGP